MMKKILVFILSGMAAMLFIGCGSDKQTDDKGNQRMVLKLAESQGDDYPTTQGDQEFARIVAEKTKGRIIIEIYPNEQLGAEKDVISTLQTGAIHFARVNTQPLGDIAPKFKVLAMPYLFDGKEHQWKVLKGEIGQMLLKSLGEQKIVGLTFLESGARSFYTTNKAVYRPEDMKGLKIRVQQSELMVEMIKCLGAEPVKMAYGEVYNGLQKNLIDGAENNWPSYFATEHYKVAKNYTLDQHTVSPDILLMSQQVWNKLSDADKSIIEEAAKAALVYQSEKWYDFEQKAKSEIEKNGNKIIEITDFKPWQEAVQPLYEKFGKEFMDVIEKIRNVK